MSRPAPYSRVLVAPVPGLSGTELTCDLEEGPRFNPPSTIVVWQAPALPSPTSSEEMTLNSVEGDVLTVTRGVSPIVIESGMMIGEIAEEIDYGLFQQVVLTVDASGAQLPTTLKGFSPDGSVSSQTPLETGGTIIPSVAGHWRYSWLSANGTPLDADGQFYVRF